MFLYIQFCILSVSRLYISAQSVGSGTKSREPRKKKKKKKAWLLAACVTSRTLYRDRVSLVTCGPCGARTHTRHTEWLGTVINYQLRFRIEHSIHVLKE